MIFFKLFSYFCSKHNLCLRAKIRKKGIPRKPQFYYIKMGCKGWGGGGGGGGRLHGRVSTMYLHVTAAHYANTPMQYTALFQDCKIDYFQIIFFFLIFAQNIDCGYTLEPPQ